MPFPTNEVEALLVACHRRCCVCHRFCGVKMETDHIVPAAEGGPDTIDNAIPVCFECHAEVHSYNDKHPRGRKFRPDELRKHKNQWLTVCREKPEALIGAIRNSDVGPLQALIDELEFNSSVAQYLSHEEHGCPFQTDQFSRAIQEGAIAVLDESLKKAIIEAYVAIGRANQHIFSVMKQEPTSNPWAEAVNRATQSIHAAAPKIEDARKTLMHFLGTDA
jgi:hypothetical protein